MLSLVALGSAVVAGPVGPVVNAVGVVAPAKLEKYFIAVDICISSKPGLNFLLLNIDFFQISCTWKRYRLSLPKGFS